MFVHLRTDIGIYRITWLKDEKSLIFLYYLDKINRLDILFNCNLRSMNREKLPTKIDFIIDVEILRTSKLLTIDEKLLSFEVKKLLIPLQEKIINFILCCKKSKYLVKDIYILIAKNIWEERYDGLY